MQVVVRKERQRRKVGEAAPELMQEGAKVLSSLSQFETLDTFNRRKTVHLWFCPTGAFCLFTLLSVSGKSHLPSCPSFFTESERHHVPQSGGIIFILLLLSQGSLVSIDSLSSLGFL